MLQLGIDPEKLYRATFIRQCSLCCCNMALVSLRLFCKNWDSCENFLGKWFTPPPPPPPAKNFPYAYVFIASSSRKRYWNWTLPWIKAQIGLSSTFAYGYRMSTGSSSARNSQVSQGAGETTTELWRKESREFSELYIYTRIVFFCDNGICIVT